MEQKKLLWIVVAVGVFLLVVIGTALILYAPSKNADPVVASISQPGGNNPLIQADPDAWVRNPETRPGLSPVVPASDPLLPPALTIVTDNTTVVSDKTTIDVTGLTVETSVPTVAPAAPKVTQKPETAVPITPAVIIPAEKPVVQIQSPKQTPPVQETKQTPKAAPVPKTTVTEYWIQAGSFSDKIRAEQARENLNKTKITSEVFTKEVNNKLFYRVRIGPYKTKTEAEYWLGFIQASSEFGDSYISEVKTQK